MSITAKELAKLLNLSEAAISMALNNKPGVSTKTRKKIVETAKELGYDFSRITEKETPPSMNGTIYFILYKKSGAIVNDTPFFAGVSEGIDSACKELGYLLNISYMHQDSSIEEQLSLIRTSNCNGIILLATEMTEIDFQPFTSLTIPLVILDTYFENISANYVLIDNIQGAYLATNYLIKKTNTQPGYLQSSYFISNFSDRSEGFFKAIRKNGMATSKCQLHKLAPSMDGAYADMQELLLQGEIPSKSYFADNDLIAAGAIKALKEAGYQIPQDISIIGFDNMPLCTYIDPPLTTIHVPKQYMGQIAVKRLYDLMHSTTKQPIKIHIATSLIPRKSVE